MQVFFLETFARGCKFAIDYTYRIRRTILPTSGNPGEYSMTFSLSSGDEYDGSFVIE